MQATMQDPMRDKRTQEILIFCNEPRTREEIQNYINIKNRDYFRKGILNPLLEKNLLLPTISGKPSSPKQKYYSIKQK
jgi:ATP-dependent DNA helicase RecG